jgi:very-short-patch-repair endonuclease
MASLEAALKVAIQVHYQVEDRELTTEPLPGPDERKQILFYESAEGGAGVLRRLVEDAQAFRDVARIALERCHFDPETGEDLGRAERAREDCEAACYDCLLSYYNQRDHRLLDRMLIIETLRRWQTSVVETSPTTFPRQEQVQRLANLCQTQLERRWLDLVDQLGLRLPSDAQRLIDDAHARPDFFYQDSTTAVFIDGPVHDTPAQQTKDAVQEEDLLNLGLSVVRFHQGRWRSIQVEIG